MKNNITVLSHAILSDSWSGKYPSDHLPVIAEVLIDPITPLLTNAHSHNDYEQEKPLFHAIKLGFASIEVDLWLIDEELYVSHNRPLLGNNLPTFQRAIFRAIG